MTGWPCHLCSLRPEWLADRSGLFHFPRRDCSRTSSPRPWSRGFPRLPTTPTTSTMFTTCCKKSAASPLGNAPETAP